jgi:hypothetical protein
VAFLFCAINFGIKRYKNMSSMSDKKLPFSGNAMLLEKIVTDFNKLIDVKAEEIPKVRVYKIACEEESPVIERSARKCALQSMQSSVGFVKNAIDSRRINQAIERNPRPTIQYFSRSDQFIDNKDQTDINTFSKLLVPLIEIKASFGDQPEYLDSYCRILHDNLERVLRVKQGDSEIFRPQIEYLKQLIFARYRLSVEEINRLSSAELKMKLLDKDENLIKRGLFMHQTNSPEVKTATIPVKNGIEPTTSESIVNAIFGNNNIRRDGEKSVERTITITIKDTVKDE